MSRTFNPGQLSIGRFEFW
nr:DUF645 family protein [Vibrio cholerae]